RLRVGAVFDIAVAQRVHGDHAAIDSLDDDGIGSRWRIGNLDADVVHVPGLDAEATLRLAREPTTVDEEDVVLERRLGRRGPIRSEHEESEDQDLQHVRRCHHLTFPSALSRKALPFDLSPATHMPTAEAWADVALPRPASRVGAPSG